MNLKNKLPSTIKEVKKGKLNAHVSLEWKDIPLSVIITSASADEMGLVRGDRVDALFKASDVILARGLSGQLSARNVFSGKIVELKKSFPLAMVDINASGCMVCAEITLSSLEAMGLKEGEDVDVVIKSSELILAKAL
ncbi:MAG: TOBE domain-containing protein [Deltaproteobacteria bacterium]|nr:TOBE domain-containing protein [Deltaproteobacteria bacterium]